MGSIAEPIERGRTSKQGKIVLESWHKALVVHCVECWLIESCKRRVLIEGDIVLVDVVVVFHDEVVQLLSGRSNGIGYTKCGLEGLFKFVPGKGEVGEVVVCIECQIGFVPLLGSTL